MQTIQLTVSERVIGVGDHIPVTEGNQQMDAVAIALDGEWDGLTKTVTFCGSNAGAKPVTVEWADEITIPWECCHGGVRVTVEGTDGTKRLLTEAMRRPIEVERSGATMGEAAREATETVVDRATERMDALEAEIPDAKAATEAANAAAEYAKSTADSAKADVEAAYATDREAWQGEVDDLLEKGSAYETRIAALETETSDARVSYGGHAYDTVGERMDAIEHTVHAIGRDVELDLDAMSEVIQSGEAEEMYPTGMQLEPTWADVRPGNSTVWVDKLNVVDHAPVTVLADGTETESNALTVQQALTLPFNTQFDPIQAFYAAPAGGLPAGSYCVEVGTTYQKVTAGDVYAFTTTVDLPEGGQLVFPSSIYSYTPVQAGIRSYASGSDTAELETVSVEKVDAIPEGYTSLGNLTTSTIDQDGTLNHLHRIALGSNRWATSALRQFLNGSGSDWFEPATKWSRPPSYVTYDGYLTGFDAELVAHMAEVKVQTCLPYCDGAASSSTTADVTYDRVFLPSAEQLYWTCTSYGVPYGVEGTAWDYWMQVWGQTSPASVWKTHAEYVMYGMGAETTARYVFERSAYRPNGYNVALCHTTGTLGNGTAYNGNFCAPACCIV